MPAEASTPEEIKHLSAVSSSEKRVGQRGEGIETVVYMQEMGRMALVIDIWVGGPVGWLLFLSLLSRGMQYMKA